MSLPDKFSAQILETSAAGYAGLAAGLLFDRQPDLAERYAPNGLVDWKAQLQQWLLELSAALDAGQPSLFESRIRWTRRAFTAREVSVEDLRAGLAALRDTLQERLPEHSIEATVPIVDQALSAVSGPEADDEPGLDPNCAEDRIALAYLKTILEGDPRRAIDQVLAGVDGGTSVRDTYLDVVLPAQREVGRMWHAAELSIAEEHIITATTQRLMVLLCERARPASPTDGTVVLACVRGNAHDLGLRATADFFEMAGWRTIGLGADVPEDDVARSVQFWNADVLVLAAALNPHIKAVRHAIERIRALENRTVQILVGGPAFDRAPDLWREVGADAYSPAVEQTEPLARKLAGL